MEIEEKELNQGGGVNQAIHIEHWWKHLRAMNCWPKAQKRVSSMSFISQIPCIVVNQDR